MVLGLRGLMPDLLVTALCTTSVWVNDEIDLAIPVACTRLAQVPGPSALHLILAGAEACAAADLLGGRPCVWGRPGSPPHGRVHLVESPACL